MEEASYLKEEKVKASIAVSYIVAVIFGITGLYKLWVYSPLEEDVYGNITGGQNAVVGGDAYNYIINGTHSIAYILIALIFVIIGSTIMIVSSSKK